MTELLMSAPPRKPRCRLLVQMQNRCPNPELAAGLCLSHLREAAEEWERITSDAVGQFPGLKQVLGRRDGDER